MLKVDKVYVKRCISLRPATIAVSFGTSYFFFLLFQYDGKLFKQHTESTKDQSGMANESPKLDIEHSDWKKVFLNGNIM